MLREYGIFKRKKKYDEETGAVGIAATIYTWMLTEIQENGDFLHNIHSMIGKTTVM